MSEDTDLSLGPEYEPSPTPGVIIAVPEWLQPHAEKAGSTVTIHERGMIGSPIDVDRDNQWQLAPPQRQLLSLLMDAGPTGLSEETLACWLIDHGLTQDRPSYRKDISRLKHILDSLAWEGVILHRYIPTTEGVALVRHWALTENTTFIDKRRQVGIPAHAGLIPTAPDADSDPSGVASGLESAPHPESRPDPEPPIPNVPKPRPAPASARPRKARPTPAPAPLPTAERDTQPTWRPRTPAPPAPPAPAPAPTPVAEAPPEPWQPPVHYGGTPAYNNQFNVPPRRRIKPSVHPVAREEVYGKPMPTERVPHALEIIRYKFSKQERAAIYLVHCMKGLYNQFSPEMFEEGWDNPQKVLDAYGFETRAELVEHVRTVIMPNVRSMIEQVAPKQRRLDRNQILQLLSMLATEEEQTKSSGESEP